MGKVLGWILIALVAWIAWKFWVISQRRKAGSAEGNEGARRRPGAPTANDGAPGDAPDNDDHGVERMVSCAHCKLHLPASEARFAAGKAYCSDEHLRLGRARQDAS
jgi:uncharacterized protein